MLHNKEIEDIDWKDETYAKVISLHYISNHPKLIEAYTYSQVLVLEGIFLQIREFGGVLETRDIAIGKSLLTKYNWTDLPLELAPPFTNYLFKELAPYCRTYWKNKFNTLYRKLNGKKKRTTKKSNTKTKNTKSS